MAKEVDYGSYADMLWCYTNGSIKDWDLGDEQMIDDGVVSQT